MDECTYCNRHIFGDSGVYDIEGDVYCSKACRRDHLLHSISLALFVIAGKGPRDG